MKKFKVLTLAYCDPWNKTLGSYLQKRIVLADDKDEVELAYEGKVFEIKELCEVPFHELVCLDLTSKESQEIRDRMNPPPVDSSLLSAYRRLVAVNHNIFRKETGILPANR